MTDTSMGSSRTITPSGGEKINQVAHKAFDEAQTNGAEPQEAFDAAAGAIREAGAEAGVSSEVVEEGIGAASEAFQQSMNEGGDPATAFDSAMEAGEAAGGDMAAPLRSEIVGRMVEGFDYVTAFEEEEAGEDINPATAFDSAIQANEVPMPDAGAGDMLDATTSSEGREPPTGETSEPSGADLALGQAVSESEANQTRQQPVTEDEDPDMSIVELDDVLGVDDHEAADS